jgi:23S rRNA pseudouridine1911/1915/1917 synthase
VDAVFKDVIPPKSNGLALLDHLAPCIPYLSSETWLEHLKSGCIKIEGDVVLTNNILNTGQHLQYTIKNYQEAPVDCRWQLLWESDDIFAVHKPANLPVSRTTRNVYNTLIQLVRRESEWPDAHLLHRLDLETSGIILLAKNKAGASQWQPKISQLLGRKIYHAVVHGKPDWVSTEFQCKLATRKESPIRCQMHVCDDAEKGKLSHTQFKLLTTNTHYSIIECELLSGRKHQIRAHLSHLGFPIVGDKIYGGGGAFYLKRLEDNITDADWDTLQSTHHLLHAFEVHINHHDQDGHTLVDNEYPQQWIEFCQNVGLAIST